MTTGSPSLLFPMLLRFSLICALVLLAPVAPARAQEEAMRIVALVNGSVITSHELDQRVRLDLLASGLPVTRDNVQRIRKRAQENLINEKLQVQEARRNQTEVSEDDLRRAIIQISTQNGSSPRELIDTLEARGIEPVQLRHQLEAQIAWGQAMRKAFAASGSGEIPKARLQAAIDGARQQAKTDRYELSIIRLPLANADARATLIEAAQALRQGRGDFALIARQLSHDASAAAGGRIGALSLKQMEPALAKAVPSMRPGDITGPLRLNAYWALVKLDALRPKGERDPNQDLITAVSYRIPLPDNDQARTRMEGFLRDFAISFASCNQGREAIIRVGGTMSQPSTAALGDLPANIRERFAIAYQPQALEPRLRDENTVEVLAMCNRALHNGNDLNPDNIRSRLIQENYATFTERRLRRLRATANVVLRDNAAL